MAQKHKGEPVLASGRLKTETWNKDGVSHTRLVLMVQTVQLIQPGIKAAGEVESSEPKIESEQAQNVVPF
ncbi:MAG TPA: hypothetical protein VFE51_11035 [Verrucomicrobiae bacterium]|nr:hypothetical protein [Verrucomicrobiae bacterium]